MTSPSVPEPPPMPEKFRRRYESTLDPSTAARAVRELGEDPASRLERVEELRDWVTRQPNLYARTDDHFLLALLRSAKYDMEKAREMVVRGVEAMMEAPEWFRNLDTHDEKVADIIDKGYCTPLPKKTRDGCQILLYRLAALPPDPKRYTFSDTIRSGIVTASFTSRDENVMVNGHVFIFDFTGCSLRHFANCRFEELRKWNRIWQKNVPGRFKGFHFYNAGRIFQFLVSSTRYFFSKKYQERFFVHNSAESLCAAIGREYLPEEYLKAEDSGMGAGKMADIIAAYKSQVQSEDFRADLLYHTHDYWRIEKPRKLKKSESLPASLQQRAKEEKMKH